MSPKSTSSTQLIDNFTASKQLELFKELKEQCFSGEVVFSDRSFVKWNFYLYLGRIIYVTGGEHPVRRWRRNLAYYFPQIVANLKSELESLQTINSEKFIISWDYYLLCLWVEQQKVDREQVTKMIRAVTTEVLFDITQVNDIDYRLNSQERPPSKQLAMIDSEQQIVEAWKLWLQWQETKFAEYSPNFAPAVKRDLVLQKIPNASKSNYQTLTKSIRGKYTFRDLAVQKQTSLLLIARSLTPYFRLGCLELLKIPDLPNTLPTSTKQSSVINSDEIPTGFPDVARNSADSQLASGDKQFKIACIDSSSLICQIMKKVITGEGYQYISDSGSLNTGAILRESSPNIIFINIELAEFSGYELCSLLRQANDFNNIPIILYSKKIGLADRVKAKMAGCSELINESLEAKTILNTIVKYTNAKS